MVTLPNIVDPSNKKPIHGLPRDYSEEESISRFKVALPITSETELATLLAIFKNTLLAE